MKFKKYFIIGIFLMLMLLCIAGASAGDVNDTTLKTGTDTIEPTNLNGAATDNSKAINADNEIIGVSSENNTKDNEIASKSDSDVIKASEENNKLTGTKTFKDLYTLLLNGGTITLTDNYIYDSRVDTSYQNGITLSKDIYLNGAGHTIDGKGIAKLINKIETKLSFENIIFKNIANNGLVITKQNYLYRNFNNCSFYNLNLNCNGKITYCNFINATLVRQGYTEIINCKFRDTTTANYLCYDYSNNALNCGDVVINSSTFENITAKEIIRFTLTLTVDSCSFNNITTTTEAGRIIAPVYAGTNDVKNSNFTNSITTFYSGTVNFENCIFENMTSMNGNRAFIETARYINNCVFRNITAAHGAINVYGSIYSISNTFMMNCHATQADYGHSITSSSSSGAKLTNITIFCAEASLKVKNNNITSTLNGIINADPSTGTRNKQIIAIGSASTIQTNVKILDGLSPISNQPIVYSFYNSNGILVKSQTVYTDSEGKTSISYSDLDLGNYTYIAKHQTYNELIDQGSLTIDGYPYLVINSITVSYGQKYYNITGAFKFGSRSSGMASTLNLSTSSGIRLGSAVVNDDGTWTVTGINSTLLLPGIYDLHGDYAGNNNYENFSNTTGNLTVTIGNFEPVLYNVDIEFGDDKILNITLQNGAGETFSGFVINLTGKSINGILSKTTDADGKVSFNISDLAVGDYNWNISTTGITGLYNPLNMSIGTFKVKRAYGWNITPYLNATVIVYGDNVSVIGGVVNKHLASPTGIITFTDGLKTDSYTLTVDDKGNFKLTLVNVTSGLKNFTILYSGDTNYSDMNYTILKEVDKYPITLNITSITPLDTTYPESITVKGNIIYPDYLPAPTGTLTLTLGDKTVTAILNEGNFTATFIGVKPGNYTNITLSFTPQDNLNYTGSNNPMNITTVSIDKFLPNVIALSNVIQSYPGIVNVIGTITSVNGQNPTGKIEIVYNNTVYAVYNLTTADNGAFNINVLNLPVGEYNLTVRYAGDDYYYNNTNTTNIFTVNPSGVKFNITIINGTYNRDGVSSRFIVNVTGINGGKYPEGIVRVSLSDGSRSWQAVLNNGIANIGITSLDAGNYTNVKVEYIKATTENHYLNNESTGHKFSIYKADPNLMVEAPTIGFGADGKIYIDIADDATGNVTVKIGLADTVTFELASGVRVYTIPKPNPGSYNITATYNGDKNYNSSVAKTTFFIERPNAFLHINSSNIQYGEVEIINFTIFGDDTLAQIAGNARGTITVYGINKNPYILNVTNGRASLSLNNLTIGEYDIFAVYSGDDELAGSYQVDSFNVTGADTGLIIITNSPINEGEDLLVDVYVNHSINDLIYLYLGDGMYAANMTEDGKFSFLIPNLKQGTYLLNASFKGNTKFNAVWNTTTVIVKKQINASVIANNSADKLNITMPDNVTGNVTVSFNGTNYTVGIVNGSALINLTNATPGEHNVTITYTDADGNNITTNITVTVPKWNSTIDLNVTNINEGDKEIIQVGVTPGATGEVIIKVNDIKYLVDLVDSKAELILDNLREGNYTVTATYTGDKYYKNSTISKMFKVTKLVVDVNTTGNSSSMDIKVPENTTGNATVNINGTNFTAEIVNGTAKINLTNATPGTYNATITYTDENGTNITTNITITVPKWDSEIELNVTNINVGDTEIIQVGVTPGATGHVFINVNNLTYYVELKNSYAELVLDNLREGNYTVTATYAGDKYYKNSTISKMFKVTKLVVDVNTTGNSSSLDVKVPGNTTGNATVNINGTNFTAEIVNGTAKINLTNATPGTYNATITYTDENGTNITTNITITVPKWDSEIDLNVTNIYVGQTEVIQVSVTPGATGHVFITVDNLTYYKELIDSKTTLNIKGLDIGNYTVSVYYSGDDKYKNSTASGWFNVSSTGINVNTTNSTDLNITFPANTTGNVTVIINGQNYTGAIVNGSAVVDLSNATPGTYNATVIYTDKDGNQVKTTMTMSVPKWNTPIDLNVTDIYFGSDETIIVNVTKGATGFVIIDVNGTVYYKELNNSKTSIVLENLKVGNYTVIATYLGDKYYNNATITKIFEVKTSGIIINNTENSTDLNITLPDNVTGNVTVILDGKNYTGTIINGSAVVDLSNATPGTYNATVIYTDKDGKQVNTSMIIAVPKWNSNVDLIVSDIRGGQRETIIINVTNGATGNVLIDVNGIIYYKELINSKTILELDNLPKGAYTVRVTYMGDDKYNNSTNHNDFIVGEGVVLTVYLDGKKPMLDVAVPHDAVGDVTVNINGKDYTGTINNHHAILNISDIAPGVYNATSTYKIGNGSSYINNDTITVPEPTLLATVINVEHISRDVLVTSVLKDVNGTVLPFQFITYKLNGVIGNTTTDKDGLFTVQCVQNSTLYIEYAGNKVYEGCNATIVLDKFLDIRNATQIMSEEYNTYAVDFALGERGGYFKFQIKDENGKALANKPVQIGFCGVVYNRVTDSEGYAQLQINLNTPFIFTFAIAFLGDETHNASFVVQQINVNKKTTTLQANAKTYKASAKTKAYTVTLKSDVCSSIDGKSYMGASKKITMKVNGKTYTANTKANGQATFKLDLTKKGTYTASISFGGDQRYDASKATAKIKIN